MKNALLIGIGLVVASTVMGLTITVFRGRDIKSALLSTTAAIAAGVSVLGVPVGLRYVLWTIAVICLTLFFRRNAAISRAMRPIIWLGVAMIAAVAAAQAMPEEELSVQRGLWATVMSLGALLCLVAIVRGLQLLRASDRVNDAS